MLLYFFKKYFVVLKPGARVYFKIIQKGVATMASNCKQLEISNVCVPHNAVSAETQVAIDEDNNSAD